MRKIFVKIDYWIFPTLVTASIVLLFLTVQEKMAAGLARSPFEAGVQALTLDSSETGYTLYMNFVLNVTFAWAAVKILVASVGGSLDRLIIKRFVSNHVIIVAGFSWQNKKKKSSEIYLNFAQDLAKTAALNNNTVVILPELNDDERKRFWKKGIKVVTLQGSPRDILEASGFSRAKMLFALCDDPLDNLSLARISLSPAANNSDLLVRCLIEPMQFKQTLALEEYFEQNTTSRVRVFNQSELIARKILSSYPPDASIGRSQKNIHIILFEINELTAATILQLARVGHYKNRNVVKVTVVGLDNDQWLQRLTELHPSISNWLEIEHLNLHHRNFNHASAYNILTDSETLTTCYVLGENELDNLRISKLILSALNALDDKNAWATTKVIALDPPGGTVLDNFFVYGQHGECFNIFSLFYKNTDTNESVLARNLLSDLDDALSIELHNSYLKKDLEAAKLNPQHNLSPYSIEWEALPENIREANRTVVDHLSSKLRAINCQISNSIEHEEATLTDQELEILAEMEHRRWWADRSLNGWRYSEVRDDKKLLHPNMVPYEELSEADKQKDRDSVLKILEIVNSDNKRIIRA